MVKKVSTTRLLFKKLIRSTKENWKQFFSVIAISFLAICLFSGLTSNANNLKERVDNLYSETNFSDIYVTTSSNGDLTPEAMETIEGVKTAEERTYLSVESNKKSFYLIAEDETNTLSTPLVTEGSRGFLLMNSYVSDNSISIGDSFSFTLNNYFKTDSTKQLFSILSSYKKTDKEDVFSNDSLTLTTSVTGVMYHPEGVQSSSFSSSIIETNYTVIQNALMSLMEENYDVTGLNQAISLLHVLGQTDYTSVTDVLSNLISSTKNQILVKANDGVDLDTLNQTIKEKIKDDYPSVRLIVSALSSNLPASLAMAQDVDQASKLTYVFPVIFFLVSILVILTTLSQMIIKERIQIGALKAIGVKKGYIYLHYISYGFILCLIGGLLGFFIGPVIIPKVMEIKYNILWDLPTRTATFFHPMSIVITLSLLLLAIIVSFLASHSVISEKPVDTLRAKAKMTKAKPSKPNFFTKHLSIPNRLAFRNIFKNKVKSLMVVLGTMGCTALLVCGFGIVDTLEYGIDLTYQEQEVVDINVSLASYSEDDYLSLESFDNVKKVEKVTTAAGSLSSSTSLKDLYVYLLDDDSSCFKIDYQGDGLTIDKTTCDDLGIKEGDTVKLIINGTEYERRVDTVFESCSLKGVFDSYKNYPDLTLDPTNYWITCLDSSLTETTTKNIISSYSFFSVKSKQDSLDYAHELLSSITTMTNVVKIFAILLAVVVIYNLASLNINERKRDIATMKVLGFNFAEITKTLVTEIMIDTIIGALIGLAFGYPLCVLVLAINKTTLITFIYHINALTYFLAFILSILTAFVVNFLLCLRIKKIKMVESLKSVE
jgi:putative ABC transport system permease protein